MRILLFLLAFCMLLPPAPSAAEPSSFIPVPILDEMDSVWDAAVIGDTFYIRTFNGLYRFRPGDEAPVLIKDIDKMTGVRPPLESFFSNLIIDGEKLYVYVENYEGEGILEEIRPEIGALNRQPKLTVNLGFSAQMNRMFFLNGSLYMVFHDPESLLVKADMQTGATTSFEIPHLIDATPYTDGTILLARYQPVGGKYFGYSYATGIAEVAVLPEGSDTPGEWTRLSQPCPNYFQMLYDKNRDALFYLAPTQVYRREKDGTETVCGSHDIRDNAAPSATRMLLTKEGQLWLAQADGLLRCDDAPKDKTPLRVYGFPDAESLRHTKAARALPNLAVTVEAHRYGEEELATLLITGREPVDVMVLDSSRFDIARMIEKGWLADLSTVKTPETLPNAASIGQKDGKTYAMPAALYLYSWFQNQALLKELGLDAPEGIDGLADVILACRERDLDILPYENLSATTYREGLQRFAMTLYVDTMTPKDENWQFDTPLFRAMMQAAERVQNVPGEESLVRIARRAGKPRVLQEDHMAFSLTQRTRDTQDGLNWTPLLLSATPDEPMAAWMNGFYIMVNAKSEHAKEAIQYVQAYLDAANDETRAMLYPASAQPVRNMANQSLREDLLQQIEALNQKIDQAEGGEKDALAAKRAELERWISSDAPEFTIDQAAIDQYRALAEGARFASYESRFVYTNSSLATLFVQYIQGGIDLEMLIREADNRLRLMRLEQGK